MYNISPESKKIAEDLNLIIYPSKNKHKKIDVHDCYNNFLFSIGDKF